MSDMTYAEKLARDLACGIFNVAEGSVAYLATVGAINEAIERCATEVEVALAGLRIQEADAREAVTAAIAGIRVLASPPQPPTGTEGRERRG